MQNGAVVGAENGEWLPARHHQTITEIGWIREVSTAASGFFSRKHPQAPRRGLNNYPDNIRCGIVARTNVEQDAQFIRKHILNDQKEILFLS
jgi:hypothetical protein